MSSPDLDNVMVTAGDRNHQRWLREAEADVDPLPPSKPIVAELAPDVSVIDLLEALRFTGLTLLADLERDVLVIGRVPARPNHQHTENP